MKNQRAIASTLILALIILFVLSNSFLYDKISSVRAQSASTLYDIIDVGSLGGDINPYAINDNRVIVGNFVNASGTHGFIWSNGVTKQLPADYYQAETTGFNVNDSGIVVGYYLSPSAINHPALWREPTFDLDPFVGVDIEGKAKAINNQGVIAGEYLTGGKRGLYIWDKGVFTDLGIDCARGCLVWDINENNQVVGGAYNPVLHVPDAFVWENGEIKFVSLTSYWDRVAQGINNKGQIVGRNINGSRGWDAFLWENGNYIILAPLDLYDGTYAYDINENEQIVGFARDSVFHKKNRAVIWEDRQVSDLNQRIKPDSGWVLEEARDINNKGEIVGYGTKDGMRHAFLLVPISIPPTSTSTSTAVFTSTSTSTPRPESLINFLPMIHWLAGTATPTKK